MKDLINSYEYSCTLVRKRISELNIQYDALMKAGRQSDIIDLDLERRLRLLHTELFQMKEIIAHLTACARRIDQRVKT